MKSTPLLPTILLILLPFPPTNATDYIPPSLTTTPLNPHTPIYLGDVFWPPTMSLIAWLPSEQVTPTEWCWKATDASDNRLFSLGGVDALRIHDYFGGSGSVSVSEGNSISAGNGNGEGSEEGNGNGNGEGKKGNAYITREGKKWADCRITPESGRMGACEGVRGWDCEGGHRWTGPGSRRWSCWVRDVEAFERERAVRNGTLGRGGEGKGKVAAGGGITDAMGTGTGTGTEVVTGAMASGSFVGAFTAGVTGV
ncbi:hypothetical protein LARI1_G007138 [Lachnellula arida]|uniref:Uncharacterized protein n=1 Tax=Lachnellula arida TaxID=1316785 RepID=A0A8T9BDI1_9HELO|nr:hypothetical protein LARI1_G007138 [Lachnellula arida]